MIVNNEDAPVYERTVEDKVLYSAVLDSNYAKEALHIGSNNVSIYFIFLDTMVVMVDNPVLHPRTLRGNKEDVDTSSIR